MLRWLLRRADGALGLGRPVVGCLLATAVPNSDLEPDAGSLGRSLDAPAMGKPVDDEETPAAVVAGSGARASEAPRAGGHRHAHAALVVDLDVEAELVVLSDPRVEHRIGHEFAHAQRGVVEDAGVEHGIEPVKGPACG